MVMENTSLMGSWELQLTRKGCSTVFCQLKYLWQWNFIAHEWSEWYCYYAWTLYRAQTSCMCLRKWQVSIDLEEQVFLSDFKLLLILCYLKAFHLHIYRVDSCKVVTYQCVGFSCAAKYWVPYDNSWHQCCGWGSYIMQTSWYKAVQ